ERPGLAVVAQADLERPRPAARQRRQRPRPRRGCRRQREHGAERGGEEKAAHASCSIGRRGKAHPTNLHSEPDIPCYKTSRSEPRTDGAGSSATKGEGVPYVTSIVPAAA